MIPQGTAGSGLLLESKPLRLFPSEMGRFHPAAGNVSLPHSYGSVHGCVRLPQGTGPPQGTGGILQGLLPAATAYPPGFGFLESCVVLWELMRSQLMEGRALQQGASASTSQPLRLSYELVL